MMARKFGLSERKPFEQTLQTLCRFCAGGQHQPAGGYTSCSTAMRGGPLTYCELTSRRWPYLPPQALEARDRAGSAFYPPGPGNTRGVLRLPLRGLGGGAGLSAAPQPARPHVRTILADARPGGVSPPLRPSNSLYRLLGGEPGSVAGDATASTSRRGRWFDPGSSAGPRFPPVHLGLPLGPQGVSFSHGHSWCTYKQLGKWEHDFAETTL